LIEDVTDLCTLLYLYDCFGFIAPGQTVALRRQFRQTERMINADDLNGRANRARLRDEYITRRFRSELPVGIPGFDDLLQLPDSPGGRSEPIQNLTFNQLLQRYQLQQLLVDTASLKQPPKPAQAPTPAPDSTSNPRTPSVEREEFQQALAASVADMGNTAQQSGDEPPSVPEIPHSQRETSADSDTTDKAIELSKQPFDTPEPEEPAQDGEAPQPTAEQPDTVVETIEQAIRSPTQAVAPTANAIEPAARTNSQTVSQAPTTARQAPAATSPPPPESNRTSAQSAQSSLPDYVSETSSYQRDALRAQAQAHIDQARSSADRRLSSPLAPTEAQSAVASQYPPNIGPRPRTASNATQQPTQSPPAEPEEEEAGEVEVPEGEGEVEVEEGEVEEGEVEEGEVIEEEEVEVEEEEVHVEEEEEILLDEEESFYAADDNDDEALDRELFGDGDDEAADFGFDTLEQDVEDQQGEPSSFPRSAAPSPPSTRRSSLRDRLLSAAEGSQRDEQDDDADDEDEEEQQPGSGAQRPSLAEIVAREEERRLSGGDGLEEHLRSELESEVDMRVALATQGMAQTEEDEAFDEMLTAMPQGGVEQAAPTAALTGYGGVVAPVAPSSSSSPDRGDPGARDRFWRGRC